MTKRSKTSKPSKPKRTEGWAGVWCGVSSKWHYVRGLVSLCGKYRLTEQLPADYFPKQKEYKHPAQCLGCQMKRQEEIK